MSKTISATVSMFLSDVILTSKQSFVQNSRLDNSCSLLCLGAKSPVVTIGLHIEVGNKVLAEWLVRLGGLHHEVLAGI
jgi:hypothetical protein